MFKKLVLASILFSGVSAACEFKAIPDGSAASTAACAKCVTSAKSSSKDCKAAMALKTPDPGCFQYVECLKKEEKAAEDKKKEDDKKKANKAKKEKALKECPQKKDDCKKNNNGNCPTWFKAGECIENFEWMVPNCQSSCCPICSGENTLEDGQCPSKKRKDLCIANSKDEAHTCEEWATQDIATGDAVKFDNKKSECTVNKDWMVPNCMQSCCETCFYDGDMCPTAKSRCTNTYDKDLADDNKKCEGWAKAGECDANSEWMHENCSKECCDICKPKAPAAKAAEPAALIVDIPPVQYYTPQAINYGTYNSPYGAYNNWNFGTPSYTGLTQQAATTSFRG